MCSEPALILLKEHATVQRGCAATLGAGWHRPHVVGPAQRVCAAIALCAHSLHRAQTFEDMRGYTASLDEALREQMETFKCCTLQ